MVVFLDLSSILSYSTNQCNLNTKMIYTHLKTIEAEVKKAFKLVDVGKAGQAPMFARLVNIERELWSIRQIMNAEEKDDQ